MVFLKHFDTSKQTLHGIGKCCALQNAKIGDLIPAINERMRWTLGTPLKLYEEIKPGMIEPMKTKLTFSQSDIQDGDVICFQVEPSDKEIHDLEIQGLHSNPVQFYDFLQNRVMIVFRPKSDSDPEAPEFNLVLSKKQTYNTMAAKVAEYLRHDPIKLRLITTHASNASPKAILKRSLNQSIAEIISPSYTSASTTVILYEKLDASIVELETKRGLEVMAAISSQKDLPPVDNRTTSLPAPAAAPRSHEATAPCKDTSSFDIELDQTAQHEGVKGAGTISLQCCRIL